MIHLCTMDRAERFTWGTLLSPWTAFPPYRPGRAVLAKLGQWLWVAGLAVTTEVFPEPPTSQKYS